MEWIDEGPVSQGKILTAILQDDTDKARALLRGWSLDDLNKLGRAARQLDLLIGQEGVVRRRPA